MLAPLAVVAACDHGGAGGPDPYADCSGGPEVGCPCDDRPSFIYWRCCAQDDVGGALVCLRDIDAEPGDVTLWQRMTTCSCPPHDGLECDPDRSQWRGCDARALQPPPEE